jgi:ribosomal protein S18 acetylase RimI-like enzyme
MDDVSTIAAVLGSSEYTSFVAKDGEAVIGFLSVKGSGYVFSLCVAPEYRRKRVATRMVEAYLKDSAAKWIYADATTESFGAPARAFYESLGMKAVPFMRYVRRI